MFRGRVASLVLIFGVLSASAPAQLDLLKQFIPKKYLDWRKLIPKNLTNIPGLDKIPGWKGGIEGYLNRAPLTTNINDASNGLPFLDGFAPKRFVSMSTLKRTPEGTFVTKPGAYAAVLRTYCLHAGTYGPSKGNGYVNAPLRGGQAKIVEKLLQVDTTKFGPNGQHTMQSLLWAILSQAKYDSFSPELRAMGDLCLDPDQRRELNGGYVGMLPPAIKQKIDAELQHTLGPIIEAEQRIRTLVTSPKLPFAEMERLAVLTGEPPAAETDRDIPATRWVLNEQGVFVRYHSIGYPRTRVDTYVPERFVMTADAQGRVTKIEGPKNVTLDVSYGDGLLKTGDKNFNGYALASVTFSGLGNNIDLKDVGWTFVGLPPGRGNIKANPAFGGAQSRMEEARRRFANIQDDTDSFDEDKKAKEKRGKPVRPMNVLALRDAVESALFASGKEPDGAALKEFLTKASMAELSDWVTGRAPSAEAALMASIEPEGAIPLALAVGYAQDQTAPVFTPSTAVAIPAQTFRQRLGITTTIVDDEQFADIQSDEDDATTLRDIPGIMRAKGWPVAASLLDRWFNSPPHKSPVSTPFYEAITQTTGVTLSFAKSYPAGASAYAKITDRKSALWEGSASVKGSTNVGKDILSRYAAQIKPVKLKPAGSKVDFGGRLNVKEFSTFADFHSQYVQRSSVSLGIKAAYSDQDAALGSFNFYAIPKGRASYDKKSGEYVIEVTWIGIYVLDSFDFNGYSVSTGLGAVDGQYSGFFGWWKKPGFFRALPLNPLDYPGAVLASDKAFDEYRAKHGVGGDFCILTDVEEKSLMAILRVKG